MLIISILVVIYSCSKHFYGGNKHKTILNPTFPITQVNPKEMNKEVGGGGQPQDSKAAVVQTR